MMIRTLVAGLTLAGVALCAVPASAQSPGQTLRKGETVASLAAPLKAPFYDVIDGRIWDCTGTTCHVNPNGNASGQSLARECANASRRLGAFATYQTGEKSFDGDALKACNAGAKKVG